MPFRLTNAPATFQRLMENCLGDLHLTYCLLYLDDMIIYSKHAVSPEAVFKKSEKGISVDPVKVACVQSWPLPKTVKNVQGFLGFTSFYQKIGNFSEIARPLHEVHRVLSISS